MTKQRTHIVLPSALVAEIDALIGARKRSAFIADTVVREIRRLKMLKALEGAAGAWKDKEHPELKDGAYKWVRKMRAESEERFRRVTRR